MLAVVHPAAVVEVVVAAGLGLVQTSAAAVAAELAQKIPTEPRTQLHSHAPPPMAPEQQAAAAVSAYCHAAVAGQLVALAAVDCHPLCLPPLLLLLLELPLVPVCPICRSGVLLLHGTTVQSSN